MQGVALARRDEGLHELMGLFSADPLRHQAEALPEALRAEVRSLNEARERLRADIESVLRTHEALLLRVPRVGERQQPEHGDGARFTVLEEDRAAAVLERPAERMSESLEAATGEWAAENDDGEEQE